MGPADRRNYDRSDDDGRPLIAIAASSTGIREVTDGTTVRNGNVSNPAPLVLPARYGRLPALTSVAVPSTSTDREMVAIAIEPEMDPTLTALAETNGHHPEVRVGSLVETETNGSARKTKKRAVAVATTVAVATDDVPSRPVGSIGGQAGAGSPPDRTIDGPCSEPRRLADERCAVASRASEEATRAADELHAARRAYDDHLTRAESSAADADARAVRAAKDAAQHAYRVARSGASSPEEQEAAAAAWLAEINRINASTKEAEGSAVSHREAAAALVLAIERLTVHADAARISAESAQEICVAAREALAQCEERANAPGGEGARPPVEPELRDDELGLPDEASALRAGTATGPVPRILRLLRGERAALIAIVDAMAGPDPSQRRHWQLLVTDLADAIIARAIEESMLDFPEEHPFWGSFTRPQCRDIAAALASLGYRFDGLGGFADSRVPTQRDLSLALGYAGLDPMRIRVWPTEGEAAVLFGDVRVAADEYLAGAGGDLTLSEMVDLLGRRADALADLWNNWGRARPALLIVE